MRSAGWSAQERVIVLIKRDIRKFFTSVFLLHEDIVRRQLSAIQEKGCHQNCITWCLDLRLPSRQDCDKCMSLLQATKCLTFCYSSLNRLRQPSKQKKTKLPPPKTAPGLVADGIGDPCLPVFAYLCNIPTLGV